MEKAHHPLETHDKPSEISQRLAPAVSLFDVNADRLGKIDAPTKEGFLALARMGHEVWNAWRISYPEPLANFSGISFDNTNWIDFSKFIFLSGKNKRKSVDFSGCIFHEFASFSGASFGNSANFSNAVFKSTASFLGAIFRPGAKFHGAFFLRDAFFDGSSFGLGVNFGGSNFKGKASFKSAAIADRSKFEGCKFENEADFSASTKIAADPTRKTLRSISFNGSKFYGSVDFSGREFLSKTEFSTLAEDIKTLGNASANIPPQEIRRGTPAEFHAESRFHGAKLHQDTTFEGAIFSAPAGAEAARAYRTLKLAMEQLKATREEQRFFRLEMKAERPSLPPPRQALSLMYEWCSDYGFNLWRPVVTLLALSLAIGGIHGLLANACANQPDCAASAEIATSDERTSDLIKYALVNIAPVPGLDKMQTELRKPLFGEHGEIAIAAIIFEILHKLVTLTMTFLFALGLRNLFKMKS